MNLYQDLSSLVKTITVPASAIFPFEISLFSVNPKVFNLPRLSTTSSGEPSTSVDINFIHSLVDHRLYYQKWFCWRYQWQSCVCRCWWSLCDIPRSPVWERWMLFLLFSPTELKWLIYVRVEISWPPHLRPSEVFHRHCPLLTFLFS